MEQSPKILKSCPVRFCHRGNSYTAKDISDAALLRLAKDPSFKHIVLVDVKPPKQEKAEGKKPSEVK